MAIVPLIFLLLAILWIIYCVFGPGYDSMSLTPPVLIRCIVGLVVIFILYLIVAAIFGAGPLTVPRG